MPRCTGHIVCLSCHLPCWSLERMSHWVESLRDAVPLFLVPHPLSQSSVCHLISMYGPNMRLDLRGNWFLFSKGIPKRCTGCDTGPHVWLPCGLAWKVRRRLSLHEANAAYKCIYICINFFFAPTGFLLFYLHLYIIFASLLLKLMMFPHSPSFSACISWFCFLNGYNSIYLQHLKPVMLNKYTVGVIIHCPIGLLWFTHRCYSTKCWFFFPSLAQH